MIIYFAAVGSDLWEAHINASEGKQRNVLFSYFDLDLGGFQFRRKSWEGLTGEPFDRVMFNLSKEKERKNDSRKI